MRLVIIGAAAVLGAAAVPVTAAVGKRAHAQSGPGIPLSALQQRGVIGRLQLKLGTIATVAGTAVANRARTKEAMDAPLLLRIERVNGKRLAHPVLYRFGHRTMKPPKIGEKFRYVGYETGGYVGSPAGEFKYVPAYTAHSYSFRTSFSILAHAR